MLEISYKVQVEKESKEQMVVCYDLLLEENDYSIECYVEDAKVRNIHTYSKVNQFTSDREAALLFTKKIADASLLPIHLVDVVSDEFNV